MTPLSRLPAITNLTQLPVRIAKSTSGHLTGVMHPDGYHWNGRSKPYFEGWYVKCVSPDEAIRLAIIPGIFRDQTGDAHAFIQVLDGVSGESWYHEFAPEAFHAHPQEFWVKLAGNELSKHEITLDLPGLTGHLDFSGPEGWPVTRQSPGIMGWYAWIPTMECYHGVVSFDHVIAGTLTYRGQHVDMTGGRGYIEKDWGTAFPKAYVWCQSNHFHTPGTSLVGSVAVIPWQRSAFTGFIVGLRHEGRLYRFTTYLRSTIVELNISEESVVWQLRNRRGEQLRIQATRPAGGLLHAPVRTEMHRRVEETLMSVLDVELRGADGKVIFRDTGSSGGLEVHGDLPTLLDMI